MVAALVLVVVVAVGAWGLLGGGSGGYPVVAAQNGMVSIPEAQVSDGQAHFFSYREGDATINFFVLKSNDGVIRAAFDACDVCYRDKLGYRQDGDSMVCIACNQSFASDQINVLKGGCNPAPLNRVVRDGQVLIAEADIKAGSGYFPSSTR
ncbi:hypothetical protein GFER_10360 [Geoalkalibacter ferrihydriticus DSM 17813]|uniref:Membrane iron-sulfur containing protein FtrD-like domain-containing protein n=1 Tax=Geoalkalibacter ferrihydriticus DSM 17813 TaxID=1121915 RepID=A0A0C2HIB0_9BACT|nr:hypothetical protein GFER_10360 [Geoalkalibacter ferrihydriticus DSM 17813]